MLNHTHTWVFSHSFFSWCILPHFPGLSFPFQPGFSIYPVFIQLNSSLSLCFTLPACPNRHWGSVGEAWALCCPLKHAGVQNLSQNLAIGGGCCGFFFKHESVSVFVPSCKSWHFYKLCPRLIPANHAVLSQGLPTMALLCFPPFHCPWGAPGQESGLPESTPPLRWALASLGPKYLKIVHSSEVEGLVCAVRLPSNLILGHTGTSLQGGTTCLCTAEPSQLALNSHSNQKGILHLDTHFQAKILYVPFFTTIFPEEIQPSSEFHHPGTSCLEVAGEGCWNGCIGTCPFSFPFFYPHTVTLVRKTPVNWCFLWLLSNLRYSFSL